MSIHTKGAWWFILHCILVSVLFSVTKHILNRFHIFELIFSQTLLSTIFLAPFIIKKFKNQRINAHNLGLHAIRSLFWVGGSAMYFYAITQINLTKAIASSFTIPIFTSLLAIVMLKEQISKSRILSLIVGFIGMLIIIQPGYGYEVGTLYAIGSALLWSVTNIVIKILGRTQNIIVKTFYFTAFSALFSLPLAIKFGQMPNLYHIHWLLLVAVLFILDLVSLSKAFQNADLTFIMPFSFLQLLFTAIIGYIVFNEVISTTTFIGSVIIILSTTFIGYFGKESKSKSNR